MLMRIAYRNVREGSGIGDVVLQEALRQKMDVIVIEEIAGEPERMTEHSGWKMEYRAQNQAVSERLDVEIEVR